MLPAREMLGDLLLDLGESAAAVREHETSLATATGRINSLAGAVRAAEQAGNASRANEFFAKPQSLTAKSDSSRPERVSLEAAHAR